MKSSFSFLLIVLLQLIICLSFPGGGAAANLEEICQKASSSSVNMTYDFCLTSLQPIPGTREVDTKGLASITINLSISNFTSTREKIADLQSKATDQSVKDALQICSVRFGNGDASLKIAQTSLGQDHIQDALSSVRAAAGSAVVCANAFSERGIQSPISDTQDGFLLCNLAAYIIQLLA
ncbi:hypothetical protein J5N97_002106 [Dioscorea zingiberensis]|uniref:Pectinesterase inhibitor domain-containing protein n=1 Tax=Dioscorea zingiberensis TaxID=325984 RepID=A0A9D5D1K0_9LILI|nr:hypothetical protein J5N97_002106 [Dioscorea zingiberensis]